MNPNIVVISDTNEVIHQAIIQFGVVLAIMLVVTLLMREGAKKLGWIKVKK